MLPNLDVSYQRALLSLAASAAALLLLPGPAWAAPSNDTFLGATSISATLPGSASGDNLEATKEPGEPDHAGDVGGHSLWYSWTPTSSGPVDLSTCAPFSPIDTVVAVYTGSTLDGLALVAANDDGTSPAPIFECQSTDSEVRFTATAGTTYRIAVDGASETVGHFSLRIRGGPVNDDFVDPEVLAASIPTGTYGSTTRLATKEPGEPDHAGDPGGHSVWYSWTPSSSAPVAIAACGVEGQVPTLLAVYTGSDLGALDSVAANDGAEDEGCPSSYGSEVRFTATAGTTYRIAVDGKEGREGRIRLSLQGAPANDAFSKAQALSPGLPTGSSTTVKLASKETGEPDHAGDPGGHSVWYSWTPSSSGLVEISTCAYNTRGIDILLAVYTGDAVGELTPVAANDDAAGCHTADSAVELTVAADTTYRIAVDGKAGSEGIFSLALRPALPANDDFAHAEELSPTPPFAGGFTKHATKEPGEPDHAGDPGGHSLWYSWTPSSSGPVNIIACGSNHSAFDTLLGVYTGSAVDALTPVASDDDGPVDPPNAVCGPTASMVEFDASAGTAYRIAVDGQGGETGQFFLAFARPKPPPNDAFDDATGLYPAFDAYSSGTIAKATKEPSEPEHAGEPGGRSVWYSWTAPSSGPVAISTCTDDGAFDALLGVYTGSAVGALTPVVGNDDGPAGECRSTDSEVEFAASSGTTYQIAVDAKAEALGDFGLILEGRPSNDDFGKPRPITGAVNRALASNRFATLQPGEPAHAGVPGGHSVWFKWTAPYSGPVSFDTCESNIDTLLAVYTGAAVGGLTPVRSSDDGNGKCAPRSKLVFEAVLNTVYRIAVDGKAGSQGPIDLRIESRPPHDDFGSAIPLPSKFSISFPGSILLATKQLGEPNHGGDPGGHSVWYSWTPDVGGNVAAAICTDTFDPVLGIYTGTEVDDLNPVATVDAADSDPCAGTGGREFVAHAGTTYMFAVDGAGGGDGHFELVLEPVAAHSLTVSRTGGGSGFVSSNPDGIACGSTCRHDFEPGTVVTLLAQPAGGSSFAGWSGGGCAGTGACQVTLGTDIAVVANFQAAPSEEAEAPPITGPIEAPPPQAPPLRTSPPQLSPPKPPRKCRPGFKKVRVKGKRKCVKRKKGRHGRGSTKRRDGRR